LSTEPVFRLGTLILYR